MLVTPAPARACVSSHQMRARQTRLDMGHTAPRGCQLSGQPRWWPLRSATVGSQDRPQHLQTRLPGAVLSCSRMSPPGLVVSQHNPLALVPPDPGGQPAQGRYHLPTTMLVALCDHPAPGSSRRCWLHDSTSSTSPASHAHRWKLLRDEQITPTGNDQATHS